MFTSLKSKKNTMKIVNNYFNLKFMMKITYEIDIWMKDNVMFLIEFNYLWPIFNNRDETYLVGLLFQKWNEILDDVLTGDYNIKYYESDDIEIIQCFWDCELFADTVDKIKIVRKTCSFYNKDKSIWKSYVSWQVKLKWYQI